jgi:conjugative transfer region protein TrbK
MERSDILRAGAVIVLIGLYMAALAAIHRRPAAPAALDVPLVSVPDDLSAELRRCNALGPQDAEDARCRAVWEENRRRFFGQPARPVTMPAAPAPAVSGEVRP